MVFGKKSRFLLSVFFGQIKPGKIVFDILDKKECFLDQKEEVFKKRQKNLNFPKGLVHGFCQKMEIFIIC